MAYDHEEQEQLAAIKAWWKQYGNLIIWVLIIVLGAYAAWTGWQSYQRSQVAEAALLYEQLQTAAQGNDHEKVQRAASDLRERYADTAYAQMAALAAAKSAFEKEDLAAAKQQLQWLADNSEDATYRSLARIRLAGILYDEKAYDEGLKLIEGEFPTAFADVIADRKGDFLTAQGKVDEARSAYAQALERMSEDNPARQYIQLKLDAIGGAVANPAA
jgi:predicted negative regulator of RcsB-dependent stress response